jgi:hypothetical protein
MPKKEILDFKPAPRLEQVSDKRPKQMEHGKHRGGRCPDSPSTRESARIEFSGMTGRMASIAPDDALILAHCTNPRRMEFSGTTAYRRAYRSAAYASAAGYGSGLYSGYGCPAYSSYWVPYGTSSAAPYGIYGCLAVPLAITEGEPLRPAGKEV